MFSLLGAGLALGLFMTPDNGKNRGMRMGMLLGFAFLTGLGLGPLLQMAIMMNPTLVPSALMITSAVFACFTGAALFAPDGKELLLFSRVRVINFSSSQASIFISVEPSCLAFPPSSFSAWPTSSLGPSFFSR